MVANMIGIITQGQKYPNQYQGIEKSTSIYHENTQNRVEKLVCIFIFVGGQDILDPAMPV